jgi:hypothetical protein
VTEIDGIAFLPILTTKTQNSALHIHEFPFSDQIPVATIYHAQLTLVEKSSRLERFKNNANKL